MVAAVDGDRRAQSTAQRHGVGNNHAGLSGQGHRADNPLLERPHADTTHTRLRRNPQKNRFMPGASPKERASSPSSRLRLRRGLGRGRGGSGASRRLERLDLQRQQRLSASGAVLRHNATLDVLVDDCLRLRQRLECNRIVLRRDRLKNLRAPESRGMNGRIGAGGGVVGTLERAWGWLCPDASLPPLRC